MGIRLGCREVSVIADGEGVEFDVGRGYGGGLEDVEAKGFRKMGIEGMLVTKLGAAAGCGKNF